MQIKVAAPRPARVVMYMLWARYANTCLLEIVKTFLLETLCDILRRFVLYLFGYSLHVLPWPQDTGTPFNSTRRTCHLVTHPSTIRAQRC
jgi:hypothetical protein